MPKLSIDTGLTKKGPLFQNPSTRVAAFMTEAELAMAQAGKDMVLAKLGSVLQQPTGRYESMVQTERVADHWEVNDTRKVLYGPWLEGTGSRNITTRFKGYHTFRLVKQDLEARRVEILRPVIQRFLNDMNG